MKWRRLAITLVLNLIVSAGATLGVLALWERFRDPIVVPAAPVVDLAATQLLSPTQLTLPSGDTPTPGPVPTGTSTIHIVESGDTLGSIALNYDLSIEELMESNGLTNPDVLSVGQALVIAVGGLPEATATAEPLGANPVDLTPIPTATDAPSSGLPNLAIRAVDDPGLLASEQVVIVNLGGAVQLGGWVLFAADDSVYTFPALRLHENGQVTVHTAVGQNSVTDLYWGHPNAVWTSGASVELRDPQGDTRASFTVP